MKNMASVSENLKKCGVKIFSFVSGVPTNGSGVIYETPNYCPYNYVLTAKHNLQEDSQTEYCCTKISNLRIYHNVKGQLEKLQSINKNEIEKRIIVFEEDFVIIVIDKNENANFQQILVSDVLEEDDFNFFTWSVFSSNLKELHKFEFERNDNENKRLKLLSPLSPDALSGLSGGGVFHSNKNILYGIISRYPNANFDLNTVDCTQISFESINMKLKSLNRVTLDTESSKHKKEILNSVVDIYQANINNVCLNLELARKRLKTDISDDWFHDPLKYIDLLSIEYLFNQLEQNFDNETYEASAAEQFFVPKKKYTLRQALVLPFIDRIIYMAVVGVLASKLDDSLIPSVYSARFNRSSKKQLIINGVEQWKKMQYAIAKKANAINSQGSYEYNCIVEIDLLNFYDNISQKLLIKKIERVCETQNERRATKLLARILRAFTNKDLGLPQNSDASSLLATFYLNQVDVYMQNRTFAYYRFMDDVKILCKNRYEARSILQEYEYELRRCQLSVNSQKTSIISISDESSNVEENMILRSELNVSYSLELNMISRLRKSNNYAYLNQAFHQSIDLLKDNINKDLDSSKDSARKLNYALNTIQFLCSKNVLLVKEDSDLFDSLLVASKCLIEKPWMTGQVCKVLNLLPKKEFENNFLEELKPIVLDQNYNTYAYQTYQLWLLFAKHKIYSIDLIQYAVENIEVNDETTKTVTGAMVIYICSVDSDYKRVILRKFGENFTNGYFQNRIAMISMRAFSPELIDASMIDISLSRSPEFTNRFKDKDLVYVSGYNESEDDDFFIEQLYSI